MDLIDYFSQLKIQTMLQYKTIAYGVSNLTDARYFAAWYVDWISFDFSHGTKEDLFNLYNAITSWIDGPKYAIQLDVDDPDFVFRVFDKLNPDAIHLSLDNSNQISAFADIPLILEVETTDAIHDLKSAQIHAFLTESSMKGMESFDDIDEKDIFIKLDEDLRLNNSTLSQLKNIGLAIRGGEEERPGYKSFDELDVLFESIMIEN